MDIFFIYVKTLQHLSHILSCSYVGKYTVVKSFIFHFVMNYVFCRTPAYYESRIIKCVFLEILIVFETSIVT